MVLNLIHQRKRRISKHENSQLDVGILWVSYIYICYIYIICLTMSWIFLGSKVSSRGAVTFCRGSAPSLKIAPSCRVRVPPMSQVPRKPGGLFLPQRWQEIGRVPEEIGCETGCNWCESPSYLPVEAQVKSFDIVAKLLAT